MPLPLWISALITVSAIAAPVDFVREVRPIFEKHCYECHSEKKQKSGLRLDIKSEAFKGGDNHAPDIIAGKAKDSPLIHFITTDDEDELMPPKGKLSSSEIETLTAWINEGAVWPDGVDLAKLADKRDHWSFKPLPRSGDILSPQRGQDGPAPATIDAFIESKLKENGLTMSPEADPVSWLRRVTFDLTGLPPTPEEMDAFLKSKNHDAVVERLLASPRYGERWAQHWLDVVRYADTHGFEVNTERPNAWPYRDYVIKAFNNDTPYDRFIKEQLVGDALGQDAATGFLVTASVLLPGQIGKDDPSKRLARQDSIDEIVVNIGQTFLGLSVGCARCHDHKFDPITAKDYYAMQAFVAGVEYGDRDLRTPEAEAAREEAKRLQPRLAEIDQELARFVPLVKSGAERPMINARENADRFAPTNAKRVRFTIKATNNLEPCIDELEVFNTRGENVALATAGTLRKSGGDIGVAERHELRFINDGRYGNGRSWMAKEQGKGWVELEFKQEQTIERVVWGRDREGKFTDRLAIDYQIEIGDSAGQWHTAADASDRRKFDPKSQRIVKPTLSGLSPEETKRAKPLMQEKTDIEAKIKAAENAQKVFAGTFRTPDDIHLLNRGDPEQPKEPVVPAVLSALGDWKLTKETPEQKRRQSLAEWIASPQNPLTARVMVNRIWQGHFGTGLVPTPSDFGRMGMKASHPELLDWLAAEFIRSGWSVKHMHRLIVLSATYGRTSFPTRSQSSGNELENSFYKDAESRYLWRFPSRRLEAESIRDSMLAVSGQLNVKMHGRGFNLFDQRGGLSGFDPIETFTPDNQRRMIYAHKVRREPETVFGAFDCPDAGQSTAIRRASTTPIQALNLFNSRFTLAQAEAFAARVKKEMGEDSTKQITRAYRLALSREPTREELAEAQPIVRQHGIAPLCRALFNSNEFLFIP
ncbi:MAG: PSD1 and planctomycete cytochrome C domain-containing protein [Verrucomicrobiaceae bacterium]|nr:PSD1 and planctomycete cytochrome C domain-containing protein [Verrucomicrobiaceae bacterium]